ncbi:hypothetical protein FDQ92_04760 [Desulfoglaeba alkanexedens ALDC]|uniref:4Fe-4S Mo/W bis-MGD-type domain-containing protein n=1 Tax=Desulfoglaeba alkanexedens ALDC TaxID=980445 RepID=A0A4P8L120_9BACT|nr:hypothetical protein FDQ92_04760 [Desulfoglaeba alkanexedens ALDC]
MDYKTILTTCPYCACGCGMILEVMEGRIVNVFPSKTSPTNAGKLCIKGWTVHEFVHVNTGRECPQIIGIKCPQNNAFGVIRELNDSERSLRLTRRFRWQRQPRSARHRWKVPLVPIAGRCRVSASLKSVSTPNRSTPSSVHSDAFCSVGKAVLGPAPTSPAFLFSLSLKLSPLMLRVVQW